MPRSPRTWPVAWAILYGYFVLMGLASGLYRSASIEPAAGFELVYRAAFLTALAAWLTEYARRHRVALPMDVGLLLMVAWFVVVPYYAVRAEGWKRGLRTLALVLLPIAVSSMIDALVVVMGRMPN